MTVIQKINKKAQCLPEKLRNITIQTLISDIPKWGYSIVQSLTSSLQDTQWHKPANVVLSGYLFGQRECRTAGRGPQELRRTR